MCHTSTDFRLNSMKKIFQFLAVGLLFVGYGENVFAEVRLDGLVHTAIYDKVRLKLDEEQLQVLPRKNTNFCLSIFTPLSAALAK